MLVDNFHIASSIVAPPPTDMLGASLTVFQFLGGLRGFSEVTSPTKYSKFADKDILSQDGAVTARVGFLIIYGPALLASCYSLTVGTSLVSSLLSVHFGKRVLESLALHDFSGSQGMQVSVAVGISFYYLFVSCMIAHYAVPQDLVNQSVQMVGLGAFAVGEIGNFYHHWLLKQMKEERLKDSSRRYVPPKGGLFELVATPHYLFEVISWVGIALVAQQFNGYLEIFSTLGYFLVRSKNTNELYFRTFTKEEWPHSRKNIIPFIY